MQSSKTALSWLYGSNHCTSPALYRIGAALVLAWFHHATEYAGADRSKSDDMGFPSLPKTACKLICTMVRRSMDRVVISVCHSYSIREPRCPTCQDGSGCTMFARSVMIMSRLRLTCINLGGLASIESGLLQDTQTKPVLRYILKSYF